MKKKNNKKIKEEIQDINEQSVVEDNKEEINVEDNKEEINVEDNTLLEETNTNEEIQQQNQEVINKQINPQIPKKPKKTKKQQREFNAKLFTNYVGKNYKKIMQEKFSIPAFFFNALYLIYRKMYILGIGLYFFLLLLLTIFSDNMILSIIISIIYLVISILLGIFTNQKYCEKAYEECKEISEKYDYISDDAIIKLCKRKGGTNIAAVIATIILASGVAVPSAVVIKTIAGVQFKSMNTTSSESTSNNTPTTLNINKNEVNQNQKTSEVEEDDEIFVITYNSEVNLDNEFSIKLPSKAIDNSANTSEKNFKVVIDNNDPNSVCNFDFSQIDGYNNSNKFLTEYAKFEKTSNPITKKINGMTWNIINFKSIMNNVTYSAVTKDNKVYLLAYEVDLDIDKTICDKYYNEVINSIKTK